jgi:transcriptional regulator with XRE-family HTH domain
VTITNARRACGMSQHELANRLDVSSGTMLAWERGENRPTKGHLDSLAAALGVHVAELEVKAVPRHGEVPT